VTASHRACAAAGSRVDASVDGGAAIIADDGVQRRQVARRAHRPDRNEQMRSHARRGSAVPLSLRHPQCLRVLVPRLDCVSAFAHQFLDRGQLRDMDTCSASRA
jgi:hypothetical protein